MVRLLTKHEGERRIFERLLALTGMRFVQGSIEQRAPPAPDVECVIDGAGPLAVELVALDAEITRTRLNNMHASEVAWERAVNQWPCAEQARLRAECAGVLLGLQIDNGAGLRARTAMMTKIQAELLARPELDGVLFEDRALPVGLRAARVHRADIQDGPRIIAPSAGSLLPPQVGKIEAKLSAKHYDTAAPLELFAYSTHDEVDAHAGAMERIEACVGRHLPLSQFRCVRVFDFGFGRLLRTLSR